MPEVISLEPKDLFEVLDARRRELGLSQTELCSRAFGDAGGNATWQNLRRGASINQSKLLALLHALGIRLRLEAMEDAYPTTLTGKLGDTDFVKQTDEGAGSLFRQRLQLIARKDENDQDDRITSPDASGGDHVRSQFSENFIPIEWLDRTSEERPFSFASDWFATQLLFPDQCRLVRTYLDTSMEPTIKPKSLVMIDTSAPLSGNRLAALRSDKLSRRGDVDSRNGPVQFSRINRHDDLWILTKDAVGQVPIAVDHETMSDAYLGQVVWVSSRLY